MRIRPLEEIMALHLEAICDAIASGNYNAAMHHCVRLGVLLRATIRQQAAMN